MQSFQSRWGSYWVHRVVLAEPMRELQDTDGAFFAQDVYTFEATSQTEHGPKEPAMSVFAGTRFRQADGRTFVTRPGYWNTNRSLEQGRKLYRQLLAQGYSTDAELIEV